MANGDRKMGINIIDDAPWGTHLCQFYQTKEDLVDILVPYFKAGLESNEFCMWVTAKPLNEEEAKQAMREAMPDFDRYLERRQIEIIPYTEWYLKDGVFDLQRVLNGWVDKLNQALANGYDGMRTTGNTAWLEKRDWRSFTEYEESINNVIGEYRMLAICTYSLEKCEASEVIDVVSNHQFALIRRRGKWVRIESSERKQAEEALRESEERYRSLFESNRDGIAFADLKGNIIDANQAYLNMLGYSKEEIKKLTYQQLTPPKWHKMEEDIENNQTLVRGYSDEYEKKYIRKDGTVFPVSLRTWLIKGENGEPAGLWAIVRDITERKQAEEKAHEVETLKELDRLRAEVLANVSHELRTPLATIKGYSTMLLDYDRRLKRDEKRNYLGFIDKATDRLVGLIDQLLDMSRLEAGLVEIKKAPTSISKLIQEAVAETQVRTPRRRLVLNLSQRLPKVNVDTKRIRQVLDNLIDNAIKYSEEGTEVVISARRVGRKLQVSVADQGIGIPAKELSKVFNRIYRTRQRRVMEVGGAGLGLSICKKLVEAHGGIIWIGSDEGKGSSCTFTLPLIIRKGNHGKKS